jgi:hypothetical protein
MAGESNFSLQITNLVGGATIDQEFCDDAAGDACKEIINQLPANLKAKCATATTLNNSTTVMDMDAVGEILHVTRLSANSGGYQFPCREIPAMYGGLAEDSTDLNYYGTATDPVYWIDGNTSDAATLYVKPTPEATQTAIVHHISYPTVDVDADTLEIANFPDEATYLVVLYAATRQLLKFQATMSSSFNSDIGTAFTAVNTELDETQAVCDKIDADLVLAKAEIVLAKAEAAELASNTDNGSDFETACDAMVTELNKVDNVIVEASTEFDKVDNVIIEGSVELDKSTALLDLGETDSEGAVNTAAAKIITELDETQAICDLINTQADSAVTALGSMGTEIGLANTEVDLANPEVDLAKAEILETVTLIDGGIDTAVAAVKASADLVGAEVVLANAEVDLEDMEKASGYIQTAQGFLSEASGYVNEVNARVAQVNGQIAVANGYLSTASGYNQTGQAYLATAQSYGNQASGFVAAAGAFASELQSKINIANGYVSEMNIRLAQAGAKRQESQSRLTAGSAYIQEANAIVSQGNAYLQEAQSYVSQAQGYANEIQSKVGIANGYIAEANARLQADSAKYQWYGDQHAKLSAEYARGLVILTGTTGQQGGGGT